MGFKGLFIGIDRYASPGVNWLSCAGRDAKAFHALFTDSFGGETTLLLDDQATVAEIGRRFDVLAACDPDDVVVVAFSGHGTSTHELVTHDTDLRDIARTTIPLKTLGEWCARIPARRLLLVLDCCFSGGIGAKALEVEGAPRDFQSVDGKLNQISGMGRVVLTASGPMERAWESSRLGHGFLTMHLIEALQGPEEIREGGQIAVLRLLDYVVRRVVDAARQIRASSSPQCVERLTASFAGQSWCRGLCTVHRFRNEEHPSRWRRSLAWRHSAFRNRSSMHGPEIFRV